MTIFLWVPHDSCGMPQDKSTACIRARRSYSANQDLDTIICPHCGSCLKYPAPIWIDFGTSHAETP